MATQKPIKKIRARSVSSAVWENEIEVNGQKRTILKATVDRRYKDGKTGTWKSSQSFSLREAFLAKWCLERAIDYMIESDKSKDNETVGEEVVM